MRRILHISVTLLLIASLGLSQIGAGFFHNKHDAHKGTVILGNGEFGIQAHGEHCKLCAIDLITLFNVADELLTVQESASPAFQHPIIRFVSLTETFAKDRAPPVLG